MKNKIWIAIVVAYLAVGAVGQQVSDTAFAPPISSPMYKVGQGPVVLLDEALLTFTPPMDVKDTPRVPVNGWYQGAVMRSGKGRVAVFGEAAMFSAQLAGPEKRPMGMSNPIASKNPQFLLNVMHWLSGKLK
jgi:hypothetical protein